MDVIHDLRRSLRRQRVKVTSGRSIIPDRVLRNIIDQTTITDVLAQCDVAVHRRNEISSAVLHGGRKIFAILILGGQQRQITKFIEHDGFQRTSIDSKLPLSFQQLCLILGDSDAADIFFERQWEFLSPIFGNNRSHRTLHDDTILPFTHEVFLLKGGFGDVYKAHLVDTHQEVLDVKPGAPVSLIIKTTVVEMH